MSAKNTLVIWITNLCTLFGAATAYSQSDKQCATTAITVSTDKKLPQVSEKKVEFMPGVEKELRSAIQTIVIELVCHCKFGLAKQITGIGDMLKLPVPVRNRIVTAFNEKQKREKIIKAIQDVVHGAISNDEKEAQMNKDLINGWENKPINFARFLGNAVGVDFINPPETLQIQQNQPQ